MRRSHDLFIRLSVVVLLGSLAQADSASVTDLGAAMHRLKDHISGTAALNADQIKQQAAIIEGNIGGRF